MHITFSREGSLKQTSPTLSHHSLERSHRTGQLGALLLLHSPIRSQRVGGRGLGTIQDGRTELELSRSPLPRPAKHSPLRTLGARKQEGVVHGAPPVTIRASDLVAWPDSDAEESSTGGDKMAVARSADGRHRLLLVKSAAGACTDPSDARPV